MPDKSATALIVDDNTMNRDMLARRLKQLGCDVVFAEDGVYALDILASQTIDLILLDIMMPRLNGLDVLQQLKSDDQTAHIPVVVISAVDDMEIILKCIEEGAEDYLLKPFDPMVLRARVNVILRRKEREDLLARMAQQKMRDLTVLIESLEIPATTRATLIEALDDSGQMRL